MTKKNRSAKKNAKPKRKAPLKLYAYHCENLNTGEYEKLVTLAHSWNEAMSKMAETRKPKKGDWGLHSVEEYK